MVIWMGLSEKFTELVFDQFTKNAQMKKEKEIKEYENLLNARIKYREEIGELRYGNFNDLGLMTSVVNNYISNNGGKDGFNKEEAKLIKELIEKMKFDYGEIYPYEVPILFDFKLLCKTLDEIINSI